YDVPCFAFLDDPCSVEGVRARAAVERATGRPPQFFVAGEAVGTVRLPSGAVSKIERSNPDGPVPAGFDPTIYRQEFLTYYPGGVVTIQPESVVSAAKAVRYDVLPGGAGLAQLVGSGA